MDNINYPRTRDLVKAALDDGVISSFHASEQLSFKTIMVIVFDKAAIDGPRQKKLIADLLEPSNKFPKSELKFFEGLHCIDCYGTVCNRNCESCYFCFGNHNVSQCYVSLMWLGRRQLAVRMALFDQHQKMLHLAERVCILPFAVVPRNGSVARPHFGGSGDFEKYYGLACDFITGHGRVSMFYDFCVSILTL